MKTKYFTKKGDQGNTTLGGKKISKSDPKFEILGNLDLLNSWVGFTRGEAIRTKKKNEKIHLENILQKLQEILFIAQAEVASSMSMSRTKRITRQHIKFLEDTIFTLDKVLSKLTKFVFSGGCELSARLDIARAMARGLERSIVRYSKSKKYSKEFLIFFNRLSSFLFVLARYANKRAGTKETHPHY